MSLLLLLCTVSSSPVNFDPLSCLHGCIAEAGDLNGDGVPDLWVAGRTDDLAHRTSGKEGFDLTGSIWALSGKDGKVLFRIQTEDEDDVFGRSMASAGDIDGDGIGDLIAGGGGRYRGKGYAEVRSGKDGMLLHRIDEESADGLFGFSVGGGRDLDGDGTPDLIVGASPQRSWKSGKGEPYAKIFSGATGRPLLLREDGDERTNVFEAVGSGVALLPDLNGDGRAEIAVGAHVFSGRDGELMTRFTPGEWVIGSPGDVNADGTPDVYLSSVNEMVSILDGKSGDIIHEWDYRGGYLHSEGMTVDAIGDVDGGEVSDLAIGASEAPIMDDPPDAGFALVVSSRTGEVIHVKHAPSHDGYDVSAIGDVDGDGDGDGDDSR